MDKFTNWWENRLGRGDRITVTLGIPGLLIAAIALFVSSDFREYVGLETSSKAPLSIATRTTNSRERDSVEDYRAKFELDSAKAILSSVFSFRNKEVEVRSFNSFDFDNDGDTSEVSIDYGIGDSIGVSILKYENNRWKILVHHFEDKTAWNWFGSAPILISGQNFCEISGMGGTGNYATISLYSYDGISNPRLLLKEEGLQNGRIEQIGQRTILIYNGGISELSYSKGTLTRKPYKGNESNEGSGIHTLSLIGDKSKGIALFDNKKIQFDKLDDRTLVSQNPIVIGLNDILRLNRKYKFKGLSTIRDFNMILMRTEIGPGQLRTLIPIAAGRDILTVDMGGSEPSWRQIVVDIRP